MVQKLLQAHEQQLAQRRCLPTLYYTNLVPSLCSRFQLFSYRRPWGQGCHCTQSSNIIVTDNMWNKHRSKDQVLLPPGNQSMLNDHWVNIWKVLDDAYIYLQKQRFTAVYDSLISFFSSALPAALYCYVS